MLFACGAVYLRADANLLLAGSHYAYTGGFSPKLLWGSVTQRADCATVFAAIPIQALFGGKMTSIFRSVCIWRGR